MFAVSYVTNRIDDKVVGLLRSGGAGLLPTDTIYGLSCLALDQLAVEKIHSLKDRSSAKPFIVLISDIKMLDLLSISTEHSGIITKYWPGALSLEFQTPDSPDWLHLGLGHFAVRLPNQPELLSLIRRIGPIVSTSANLEGHDPACSVNEAQAIFGDKLDFYVDTGKLDGSSSTLAVVKDGRLKVIRQGAVKIET